MRRTRDVPTVIKAGIHPLGDVAAATPKRSWIFFRANSCQEFRPDIMFLDIAMPGMDGYETATRLRQLPGLEGIPLVALTGYGQESDRHQARDAGFTEFLVKPAAPDVVAGLVSRLRPDDTVGGRAAAGK
jgi:CheY-like chemotaxis protein